MDKKKRNIFCSLKKNKQPMLNPRICALFPSLVQAQVYSTRRLLLFEKNTPLYFFTLCFSLSLSLYLSLFYNLKETHPYTLASWLTAFFFLRFTAREELMYFSSMRMTYKLEKKRYFTYVADEKNHTREKQVMHISLRIL